MSHVLCDAMLSKIEEQIDRTVHLIQSMPAEQLGWKPPIPGAWPAGALLGHFLDVLAGFCAVLYSAHPDLLRHFLELRELPVNQTCDREEAGQRISLYRSCVREGFAALQDEDLGRRLPTVFVVEGESVLTLLLGNLEHFINHKHQLFTYLKLMGLNVGTPDLYRLRGSS
jgi:DinB family protein